MFAVSRVSNVLYLIFTRFCAMCSVLFYFILLYLFYP
jgi:hypothetical protein